MGAFSRDTVTAFAPATVANVAVGFDVLGFAVGGAGDRVTVERTSARGVEIAAITGTVMDLPRDPEKNTATLGLLRLVDDLDLDFGFRVSIQKGIALGSGMGGSAASAVGAIVAANAFLPRPLAGPDLLKYSLIGEGVASGAFHADNIAPCLYGGLTLVRSVGPVDVISIPWPAEVHCVLVHPHLQVNTREARGMLKPEVRLQDHVRQSANLGAFIASCFTSDLKLMSRSLSDVLIEPQRASLIPGFKRVKAAALQAGALGCSISGSGPALFALVAGAQAGEPVRELMVQTFRDHGVEADAWVGPISNQGARLV